MSTPRRSRLRGVLIFTTGYTALGLGHAILTGNWHFAGYLIVIVAVIACLMAVDRRSPLPRGLMWGFSGWGLFHIAGGFLPVPGGGFTGGLHRVLYNWWLVPGLLRYDQVVHAYGFGVTTWLCWRVVSTTFRGDRGAAVEPSLGVLVLCIAASMGFGAFNELIEFVMSRIFPNTNVGDYSNTGWDLVANLAGACIAAVVIRSATPDPASRGRP